MKHTRSAFASLTVAALLFTACGGSDDGSSGPQKELSDKAIELIGGFAEEEGITVDEGCVRDVINALSDEEAAAGLAALADDSDSDAFDATGEKIEDECFSQG